MKRSVVQYGGQGRGGGGEGGGRGEGREAEPELNETRRLFFVS
jgi:hypothetical protein